LLFSFFISNYRRLEARTIRHGGNLWPFHTPEAIADFFDC